MNLKINLKLAFSILNLSARNKTVDPNYKHINCDDSIVIGSYLVALNDCKEKLLCNSE